MIVITGGQSFNDIAEMVTLSREYGAAIAAENNMAGTDIAGKKFRLVIPDNWALTQFAGKTVTLPQASFLTTGKLAIIAGLVVGYLTLK